MNTSTTSIPSGAASPQAADASPATRTRVWDLPTRIFHWTLAASFAGGWITGDSERFRDLHVMLGYTFAAMLIFRMVWGVVGTRYARFSSFTFPPSRVFAYLKSLLSSTPEHHLGHNPAGALAILAMLGLGFLIFASGLATYQEVGGEWLEELHEGASSVMLAVVAVHIVGVLVSSLLHRENLARAMLTGWKRGTPEVGIRSNRPLIGALLVAGIIALWGAWQMGAAPDWLPGTQLSAQGGGSDRHHDDDDD